MTDHAKMPDEIYAFKTIGDALGNCWQEYGEGDFDPESVGAKYIRADLAPSGEFPVAHISDLTKLIMRLCYKIKEPCKLKEQALDYIKRHGLPTGSILRDQPTPAPEGE